MPGELLPPRLPCLPAHVLTYSRLACPWSQALDRRDGQHQVNLLFGLRRRAEPPEAAAAAPRRPVQQEAARGRCARAEARWWPQWALAHVVEWTLRSMHHVDVHVTPAVHCDSCAQMLLALQAHVTAEPLFASPISVDVLRAEMCAWHDDAERRSRRRHGSP